MLLTVSVAAVIVWFRGRPFDRAAWNDEARVRDGVRLKMARNDVSAMLGQPTDRFPDWDLAYWLGAERGFISIDTEWLVLRFDRERVSEVRIVRD